MRASVRTSVRAFQKFSMTILLQILLYFSEILHGVTTSYGGKCNILGFLKIIFVASPGALLWLKKPQNELKWLKMTLFALWHLIYPLLFPETWSKCGGNCTKYKTTVVDLGKILVRVPRGHLGLKNAPFRGCFFPICRVIDMYVFLVVFHVLNSKINVLTPETAPFVHFQ